MIVILYVPGKLPLTPNQRLVRTAHLPSRITMFDARRMLQSGNPQE
jgi:hypothetical protein